MRRSLLILLLLPFFSQAQNIVPNYSFEQAVSCPTYINTYSGSAYIENTLGCVGWGQPTRATPDYYNACDTIATAYWVGVPNNWIGYQAANDGIAYAGFYTYDMANEDYKEYLITAIPALEIGATYKVTIHVSLADSSRFATDAIGVLFTTNGSPNQNTITTLNETPQIDYSGYGIISDKLNWTTLTGTFKAEAAYTSLIIGGFKNSGAMNIISVNANTGNALYNGAYYYIDNISVENTSESTVVIGCDTLSMPDSLKVCDNNSATLPAAITGCAPLSISWSPGAGLDDSIILNPTLSAGNAPGWRYLTIASLLPGNLVVNGDFSAGNMGFTSDYTYAVSGPDALLPPGVYTITTNPDLDNPNTTHAFGDHTTGTGNMLAINGASTPINVWCENIAVTPHTGYAFSAWFANWSSDVTDNLPQIQFEINGSLIGSLFNFPGQDGDWTQFYTTWNSDTNTNVTICINDQQTAYNGNDFAIDDISFQPVVANTDSIYIDYRSCVLLIHDVITPNGDGKNDTWVIEGIQNYSNSTVQLYDKWGNRVFERVNYNNDWSGGRLPDGTYYYLVKLNAPNLLGGKDVWTGSLLIKR